MIWRTGTLLLATAEHGFVLVDPGGKVDRRFEPRSYSDEDDLWHWEYLVLGDRFVERTRIEGPYVAADRRVRDEVLFTGLVAADDEAHRAVVATILGDDSVVQEERRLREAREADARVAAIPRVPVAGDLARARAALEHRVRAWGDPLATTLLASLARIARVPNAALHAAYARGCLHVCFESDALPPLVDEPHSPDPALAAALTELAATLDREAGWKDDIDARGTAAAYYGAAMALAHAAKLAGPAP